MEIYNSGENIEGHLYHYTDINGLYGILKSETFRATQSEYLNDSAEIVYIKEVLQEVLKEIKNKIPQRLNEILKEQLLNVEGYENVKEKIIQDFYKSFEEKIFEFINIMEKNICKRVFLLSFSKKEDVAHLFSSYAKNDGYCLGFDSKSFVDNLNISRNDFIEGIWNGPIIYDKKIQVNNIVDVIMSTVEKLFNKEIDGQEVCKIIGSKIGVMALFYKNSEFVDEREYRIAIILKEKSEIINCIEHRVSNNLIIPYIEANFDINSLKEIMIGPTNKVDIIEKSLKSFLEIKKFKKESDKSVKEVKKADLDIKIKKSKISLRY